MSISERRKLHGTRKPTKALAVLVRAIMEAEVTEQVGAFLSRAGGSLRLSLAQDWPR